MTNPTEMRFFKIKAFRVNDTVNSVYPSARAYLIAEICQSRI